MALQVLKAAWVDVAALSSALIPPLQQSAHKGSMGRVGVIGGCAEYSGAPYYAALSGLKTGADLSWVLCSEKAAVPIKSYTPELMVTPWYDDDMLDKFTRGSDEYAQLVQGYAQRASASLPRMQALILGPGLGRHPLVIDAVALILASARSRNMPIVVDADALYMVTQNLSTVRGYGRCILTPNRVEFDRLVEAVRTDMLGRGSYDGASSGVGGGITDGGNLRVSSGDVGGNGGTHETWVGSVGREAALLRGLGADEEPLRVRALSAALGVTVLRKGAEDLISCGGSGEWGSGQAGEPGELGEAGEAGTLGESGALGLGGTVYAVVARGSPRRCGGQGDVLAGTLGVAFNWALQVRMPICLYAYMPICLYARIPFNTALLVLYI
jgi:NAD(P)H-hydrate repair Nnr-like enzyme with NAD(P)H-hydrate dehydratase domain